MCRCVHGSMSLVISPPGGWPGGLKQWCSVNNDSATTVLYLFIHWVCSWRIYLSCYRRGFCRDVIVCLSSRVSSKVVSSLNFVCNGKEGVYLFRSLDGFTSSLELDSTCCSLSGMDILHSCLCFEGING